jgi:hypothetical protein
MSKSIPFSKLKKQIESFFLPELKMKMNCISYPVRSQYGSSSIFRFYVQLEKEVIFDFPKDFPIKNVDYHLWEYHVDISSLIRDYIDTPVLELPIKTFSEEHIEIGSQYNFGEKNNSCDFKLGLTDIFKSADRRLGKEKLTKWSKKINNPAVNKIMERRKKLISDNSIA